MHDRAFCLSQALLRVFQLRQQHQIVAPTAIVQQLVGQLLRPSQNLRMDRGRRPSREYRCAGPLRLIRFETAMRAC